VPSSAAARSSVIRGVGRSTRTARNERCASRLAEGSHDR
jgi:hypothetical protein